MTFCMKVFRFAARRAEKKQRFVAFPGFKFGFCSGWSVHSPKSQNLFLFFASVIQLYLVSERCGKRREKEDPDFRHKTCVVYCDILLPLTQTCIQIRDNCLVVRAFELSRQFPFVLTIQKMLNPTGARSTAIFVERDRIIRRI